MIDTTIAKQGNPRCTLHLDEGRTPFGRCRGCVRRANRRYEARQKAIYEAAMAV